MPEKKDQEVKIQEFCFVQCHPTLSNTCIHIQLYNSLDTVTTLPP